MTLDLATEAPPAFAGQLVPDPSAPTAIVPLAVAAPVVAFPSLAEKAPLTSHKEGDRRWVVLAGDEQVGAVWDTGGGYVAWYVRHGGGFASGVKQAVDRIAEAARRTR